MWVASRNSECQRCAEHTKVPRHPGWFYYNTVLFLRNFFVGNFVAENIYLDNFCFSLKRATPAQPQHLMAPRRKWHLLLIVQRTAISVLVHLIHFVNKHSRFLKAAIFLDWWHFKEPFILDCDLWFERLFLCFDLKLFCLVNNLDMSAPLPRRCELWSFAYFKSINKISC